MIYSCGMRSTRTLAEKDAGLTIVKSLEASDPHEISQDLFTAETSGGGAAAAEVQQIDTAKSFARPKRPGRR